MLSCIPMYVQAAPGFVRESVARPLPPQYQLNADGSVTLRICFNWSCASRDVLTFTAADMVEVRRQMSFCGDASLADRLQRVRIGIWQMELLAQKYQPLLANDRAINDYDRDMEGRTDCVDNASNSTVFLYVFEELGWLPQWKVMSPQVRDMFSIVGVHWTAVLADQADGDRWTIDSWFRPHGHLPVVLPLSAWIAGKKGWEPPFDTLNVSPRSITELCPGPLAGQ